MVESVNESVKESVKEVGVEDIPQEVPSSDTDLEEFHYESMDPESDFDLEEEYLNKLKIQRKRVSFLSCRLNSCRRCTKRIKRGFRNRSRRTEHLVNKYKSFLLKRSIKRDTVKSYPVWR